MKITPLILFLILFTSCNETIEKESSKIEQAPNNKNFKHEFQSLIDSANVAGSILIYDIKEDQYYSNDFEWSNIGFLPASTFKIPNTIIGLETGVIESDSTVFKWDGERKWMKRWEQDLILKDALQFSCVPCYQELARNIGTDRMKAFVQKLNYGNLVIDSSTIDDFWLMGESRISQMQQIDFLKRFYNSELPITERTEQIMRDILLIETNNQYKLSGKTGLSNENEIYNGWFVGYLELEDKTYLFATNLEPKEEFDLDSFIKKRLDLTLLAFRKLQVLR